MSNNNKQVPIGNNTNAGLKYDSEKPRMDLVDPYAIEQVAKVLGFGAKKYEAHNWRKGLQWSRLIAGVLRHVNAFNDGEDLDPETGISHAAHAMCGLMFLVNYTKTHKSLDDRYTKPKAQVLDGNPGVPIQWLSPSHNPGMPPSNNDNDPKCPEHPNANTRKVVEWSIDGTVKWLTTHCTLCGWSSK